MIAIDFEYHRASSVEEALNLFANLHDEGKDPLFFNGGTEIITLLRINSHQYHQTKAVIDIKHIPECRHVGFEKNQFVIGSSVSLARLEEMTEFPLLAKNCSRIGDHTTREKVTIGGNICGSIKYKEALLPLLVTDSTLVIADDTGLHELPVRKVFDQKIKLKQGAFIVQILVDKAYLALPYVSKKILKVGRIGYPLLTVSALQMEDEARFAFSGLSKFPFRSRRIEEALNDKAHPVKTRIENAIKQFPGPMPNDQHGSSAYREFVLRHVLEESLAELKREKYDADN